MRVKTGTEGKTKDVDVVSVTPENYIVPKGEEHLVHAVIEVRKFDQDSGKRISIPRIQKFGVKSWRTTVETNLKKQGYTITILHDPAEWLAEQDKIKAEQAQARAARAAEDKAAADEKAKADEQARIDAAVAAALKKQDDETQKKIDAAVAKALKSQGQKAGTGTEDKAAADEKAKADKAGK